MKWNKSFRTQDFYDYVSSNQHGNRYKKERSKRIATAKMICDLDNAADLTQLILLSHHLDVPVRYDFESSPQCAYLQVVGAESLNRYQ